MDKAFVDAMTRFFDLSMLDREESKKMLAANQKCLTQIDKNLAIWEDRLEKWQVSCEKRGCDCALKYAEHDREIKSIPTAQDKKTIETRLKNLENLLPWMNRIIGGLILLGIIGIPIAKKLGLL